MILRYAYLARLRRQLRRFVANSKRAREVQLQTLLVKLRRAAESDYGRKHDFARIGSVADFRARVPVQTYEDHQPYIARVLNGKVTALFAPGTKVLMFAMTSGTTGEPKRLPITEQLLREYKAGWKLWAGGVYGDHPHLMRQKSLQLTSDWQQYRSPCGVPCGQISGLAASTRPRIAQFMFLPPPATAQIHDPAAKHYTTLRFALASKRVGILMTANPSTLVEFARRTDDQCESLLRDIHDGTLSCEVPPHVRRALAPKIRYAQPKRARELRRLASRDGMLLPRHAWPDLGVIGVWTGGSVGVFLPKLADLYGPAMIRDHGLHASEGRMTIPLASNTSSGLLDFYHHFFEFVPVEEHGKPNATVLEAHELETGRDYFILLTTSGGLYRYDIHDVVRCTGYIGQAPQLEFLNKGKSFSSLTGEKISEHQVVRATKRSLQELGLPFDFFTVAPVMGEVPQYVLLAERRLHGGRQAELAQSVQTHLAELNEEYAATCASGRLLPLAVREVPEGTWVARRQEMTRERGNFEEYKHPYLVPELDFSERAAAGPSRSAHSPGMLALAGISVGGTTPETPVPR